MKTLSLLGSTGSIGMNVLAVVRQFPDRFRVAGLSAGRRVDLLAEQVREFRPEVVSVRACATPAALADLILASSCSPPMTSLLTWNGRHVLDGGVVDNVPVCALDDAPGETLVLLTRRYPALPAVPGRTYIQPSETIPVSAWDYTSPDGLQFAYDLGRRDGEAFVASLRT